MERCPQGGTAGPRGSPPGVPATHPGTRDCARQARPTGPRGHSDPMLCTLSSNTRQLVQDHTPHSPQVTLSLRFPHPFWPPLNLSGHCCGQRMASGTGATIQGRSVGLKPETLASATHQPGEGRASRHLPHWMLPGQTFRLSGGASACDGAGPGRRRRQPLFRSVPHWDTIYFLNFFLFRAFHSPSCVARLLKSCLTFRFLSASLKKRRKNPIFTFTLAFLPA